MIRRLPLLSLRMRISCSFRSFSNSAAASSPNKSLYMWGTDSKGSLLKPKVYENSSKVDVPQKIDQQQLQQLFSLNANASNTENSDKDDETTIANQSSAVFQTVVCGPTDTAWILDDGTCFVAGKNAQGQLGQNHKNPVMQPTQLKLPFGTNVATCSMGSNCAAYVDVAGDLYTCGFGGSAFAGMGALGHGSLESYTTPKLVESIVQDGVFVRQVQVGEAHMTVLTTEGEVLTCGAGGYGRLGNYETTDQMFLEPVELLTTGVTAIAGGKSFTLALTADGVIYSWGRNHKGQLGTGLGLAVDMYAMQAVPEPIESDELLGRKVVKIAAGSSHAACITESGELFYWGSRLFMEPTRVNELLHSKIVDVSCGQDYTLAIDENGKAYSFGKAKTGVLGLGGVKKSNQATLLEAFGDLRVSSVSAGWTHAAALVEDAAQ
jgi:alpha-tubulin suppressor-like RCC1 family protein